MILLKPSQPNGCYTKMYEPGWGNFQGGCFSTRSCKSVYVNMTWSQRR